MSTEEGGPFRAFELGSNGLAQGANSPLQPAASIFPPGLEASKRWGLGISAHPARKLVYVGMATVNKIAVYRYDDAARLSFVRAVDAGSRASVLDAREQGRVAPVYRECRQQHDVGVRPERSNHAQTAADAQAPRRRQPVGHTL